MCAWRGATGECIYEAEISVDEDGAGHCRVLRVCDDPDMYTRSPADAGELDRLLVEPFGGTAHQHHGSAGFEQFARHVLANAAPCAGEQHACGQRLHARAPAVRCCTATGTCGSGR